MRVKMIMEWMWMRDLELEEREIDLLQMMINTKKRVAKKVVL
jgi:hypothetical protein